MLQHPQVLATVGGDQDSENLICKLTSKETDDILSFLTDLNTQAVMHLHVDKGRSLGEWQTRHPRVPAHINRGLVPNHPSDLGQHSKIAGIYLLPDEGVAVSRLNLRPLTPSPISRPHHPTSQVVKLQEEFHCMLGDQSLPPYQKGLNFKASIPHKLADYLLGYHFQAMVVMPKALEEVPEELLQFSKIRTWHHRLHQEVDRNGTQDRSDESGSIYHGENVSLPTLEMIIDMLLHRLKVNSLQSPPCHRDSQVSQDPGLL